MLIKRNEYIKLKNRINILERSLETYEMLYDDMLNTITAMEKQIDEYRKTCEENPIICCKDLR